MHSFYSKFDHKFSGRRANKYKPCTYWQGAMRSRFLWIVTEKNAIFINKNHAFKIKNWTSRWRSIKRSLLDRFFCYSQVMVECESNLSQNKAKINRWNKLKKDRKFYWWWKTLDYTILWGCRESNSTFEANEQINFVNFDFLKSWKLISTLMQ